MRPWTRLMDVAGWLFAQGVGMTLSTVIRVGLGGCLGLMACGSEPSADATGSGSEGSTGPLVSASSSTGSEPPADGTTASSTGAAETTAETTDGSSSGSTTGSLGTSGSSGEPGGSEGSSTGEPLDCEGLLPGPLAYVVKAGAINVGEDFAWDDQGNAVGASQSALFRSPYAGAPQLWVPGISSFIAGFRATSDGVFVYADVTAGTLFRINPLGAPEPVLGGLSYPNGLDVDLDGHVYVAEESASRVRRINAATGEFTILAEGLNEPNGVSFSPDYQTLYVGSFGGGTITAIHLNPDMTPASVDTFFEGIGGGALDGMAVDACGNVYVCEYGPAIVWRITPDGATIEPLVNLGQETGWIPNMQFGSGYGGWDTHTLYVIEIGGSHVFEVPVGVTDKPRAYP